MLDQTIEINGEDYYLASMIEYENETYYLGINEDEDGNFNLRKMFIYKLNKFTNELEIITDEKLIIKLTPLLQSAIEI